MAITTQHYDRLTASAQAPIAWAYGRHVVAGNLMLRHDTADPYESVLFISLGEGEWDAPETIWVNGVELDPANYHFHPGIDGEAGGGGVTGDQKVDLWFPAGLEELTFSRTAYIVVRITDPEFSPEREFDVRGIYRTRKVGIYDAGGTQTSFVWSENPVWQALDLLLLDLPASRIDFASFVAEAAYAAETVAIDSVDYPRFVSHVAFTSQTDVGRALETVLATCRGYLIDDGGKVSIRIDKARSAVHTLGMANIADGSFRAFTRDTRRAPNKLLIDFRDIENDHEFISFTDVEREWHQDLVGRVQEQRLDLGNTYQQQARRIGHYFLQRSVDDQQMCSLVALPDAAHLQPGDRVDVQHREAPWEGLKAFEVIEATEEPDDTRQLLLQEYDVNAFTDAGEPQQLIEGGVILGPTTNPDVAPGDVTDLAVGTVTQDPEDPMLVRIPLTYSAPATLNGFDGVEVHLEAPDAGDDPVTYPTGKVYPQGWHRWTADPGEIILRIPYPKRNERWYVYPVSRNDAVVGTWKHRSDGSPSPFVLVDIAKNPGGGGTIAPNVTNVQVTVDYPTVHRARSAQRRFQPFITWDLPTGHADYAQLHSLRAVVVDDTTGIEEFTSGAIPVDHAADRPTGHAMGMHPAPETVETYKIRVYAINQFGQVSALPAESGTFLVGPLVDAPAVVDPSVTVQYDFEGSIPRFRFAMEWTLNTGHADFDEGFEGVVIEARPTGSGADWTVLAREAAGSVAVNTDFWPRPAENSDWDIRFVPFNQKRVRNEAAAITLSPITVLAAAVPSAPTGFTASRTTSINEAGVEMYGFAGDWTNPVDLSFSYVVVTARRVDRFEEQILAIEREGSDSFVTDLWPVPENLPHFDWVISAWAYNALDMRGGASQLIVRVEPGAAGALKLSRAAPGQVGPGLATTGSDLRANPGQGLEFVGAQLRADLGAGLAFSANDLRVGVLGVVNEMLGSGAVTGPKILANSIGAVHAVFQGAAIQNADIADLSASKIITGTLVATVGIGTGGSIVVAGGSNTVTLSPTVFRSEGSSHRTDLLSGVIQIQSKTSSQAAVHQSESSGYLNTSGILVAQITSFGGSGAVSVRNSGGAVQFEATATQTRVANRARFDQAVANGSAPSWTHRIPVDGPSGFLGYLKVSSA